MRPGALLLALAPLAACATTGETVGVREVGRGLQCQTPGSGARAEWLADAQALRRWQDARGLTLADPSTLADRPHAVVELGQRPTAGFGLSVGPTATVRDGILSVSVAHGGPPPGRMVAQVLTSPCVLVELPASGYTRWQLRDADGTVWLGPFRAGGSAP